MPQFFELSKYLEQLQDALEAVEHYDIYTAPPHYDHAEACAYLMGKAAGLNLAMSLCPLKGSK